MRHIMLQAVTLSKLGDSLPPKLKYACVRFLLTQNTMNKISITEKEDCNMHLVTIAIDIKERQKSWIVSSQMPHGILTGKRKINTSLASKLAGFLSPTLSFLFIVLSDN